MAKLISVFEISYWCYYYYDLGEEEFWSMVASNQVDFEFFDDKPITDEQTKKTISY